MKKSKTLKQLEGEFYAASTPAKKEKLRKQIYTKRYVIYFSEWAEKFKKFGRFFVFVKWKEEGKPGNFADYHEWYDLGQLETFEIFQEFKRNYAKIGGDFFFFLDWRNNNGDVSYQEYLNWMERFNRFENSKLAYSDQRIEWLKEVLAEQNAAIRELKSGRLMERKSYRKKDRQPTFCQKKGVDHQKEVLYLMRVSGQCRGIASLIEEKENYSCPAILNMILGAIGALKNIGAHILQRHREICLENDETKFKEEWRALERANYEKKFDFLKYTTRKRQYRLRDIKSESKGIK